MITPRDQLRIGDAEREAAASALGEHFASGRLTHEEYDERAAAVWAAKTNADLYPLFTDLPSPHGPSSSGGSPSPGASAGPVWRRAPWRVPFVPLLLIAVALVIALPGPPWPLFVLFWLWVLGFSGRGWGRWPRTGHPRGWSHPGHASGRDRAERGSWS